jgi:hypothetical protein
MVTLQQIIKQMIKQSLVPCSKIDLYKNQLSSHYFYLSLLFTNTHSLFSIKMTTVPGTYFTKEQLEAARKGNGYYYFLYSHFK